MELKQGYKQTDAGMIPNEWNVETLERVCTQNGLVRGPFGGTLKKEFFVRDGYKVYEQRNAIYRDADLGSYFVDEAKYRDLRRFEVREGDFIISCSGTIGRIYQIPKNARAGIINQALLKIETNNDVVYDRYFLYVFEWDDFQKRIIDNTQGGAMQNLVGMEVFRKISITLPSLPEQRAIAAALSDVDALLAALDALIAKKRLIKQGAMQELLTGKRRLRGVSNEWEKKKLVDVCELQVGRRPRGGVTEEGDVPSLGGENIYNEDGLNLSTIKRVSKEFFLRMTKGILNEDDVLINKDGANTGKVALYVDSGFERACINEHLFIMRGNEYLDNHFLYYSLCLATTKQEISKQIASSAQPGLNRRFVETVGINIPDVKEQQAIAEILFDMDAEIAALEHKRAKTRLLKQGMMQELLTGRIRLI